MSSIVVSGDTFDAVTFARTRGPSAIAHGPNTITFGTDGTLLSTPSPSGPDVIVTTEERSLSETESRIIITFKTVNGKPFVDRGQKIDDKIIDTIASQIGFRAGDDGIDFVTPVEYTSARSNYFVDGSVRASFNTLPLVRSQASPEELVLSLGVGLVSPPGDIGAFGLDQIRHTITVSKLNTAPEIDSLSVTPEIDENGTVTLTGTFEDPNLDDLHTVEIDWNDPNDSNPTILELDPGQREFTLTHIYLDDGPAPGNGTPSDIATISVTVRDDNNDVDTDSVETLVENVAPTIAEVMVESVFIDDDDDNGIDDDIYDDEGLLVTVEGTFTEPGSLDTHTGEAIWSDGVSTDLTIVGFDGFTGSFTTTRFLSEDELEDNFPEIDDDDNNFPRLDDDDIFKVGVNLTITDDDTGTDTKLFEFFAAEEGGIFVPEGDVFV